MTGGGELNWKLVVRNTIALPFPSSIAQFLYFTHLSKPHTRSHQAARLLSLLSSPQNHATAGLCFPPLSRNSLPDRQPKNRPSTMVLIADSQTARQSRS
ncbi:hypothetical protein [Microcoleus sp. herbarium12]|uniref:hypothetical protein n=1 Tax=Microcoleus sp. herbarium12 TaxID=3055437 RepID=UPI002FD3D1DA